MNWQPRLRAPTTDIRALGSRADRDVVRAASGYRNVVTRVVRQRKVDSVVASHGIS
jgi:hypothetical protein